MSKSLRMAMLLAVPISLAGAGEMPGDGAEKDKPLEFWVQQIAETRNQLEEASNALVRAGEKSIPSLLKLLKDERPLTRRRAAEASPIRARGISR